MIRVFLEKFVLLERYVLHFCWELCEQFPKTRCSGRSEAAHD